MTTTRRRLGLGTVAGLLAGAAIGAASALTWDFEPDRLRVFFAWALGGAFLGGLLAAALPRLRGRVGAAVAGATALTPALLGLGMAVPPLRSYLGALVLAGFAMGGYLGIRLRPRWGGQPPELPGDAGRPSRRLRLARRFVPRGRR